MQLMYRITDSDVTFEFILFFTILNDNRKYHFFKFLIDQDANEIFYNVQIYEGMSVPQANDFYFETSLG